MTKRKRLQRLPQSMDNDDEPNIDMRGVNWDDEVAMWKEDKDAVIRRLKKRGIPPERWYLFGIGEKPKSSSDD